MSSGEREGDVAVTGKEEKWPSKSSVETVSLPSEPPSLSYAMSVSIASTASSVSTARLSADSSSSSGVNCSDADVVLESSQESETAEATEVSVATASVLDSSNATLDNNTLMSECLMLQADEDLQSSTLLMFDFQQPTTSSHPPSTRSTASGGAAPSISGASTAFDSGLTRAMSLVEEVEMDEVELAAIEQVFSNLTRPADTATPSAPTAIADIESILMTNPALPLSFRYRSIVAATDLSSQLWCEHQLHLSLLYGRRVSPAQQEAMDRGTARHDQLEREMHDVVEVKVSGREEEWGLRFLNGVVGLHELLLVGKTRELMVMGRVMRRMGERVVWIMGVIDEVERVDNLVIQQRWQQEEDKEKQQRLKLDENREKRRRRDEEERMAQLEAQWREDERKKKESIRNHFPAFRWESGAVIELDGETKAEGVRGAASSWKDREADTAEDDDDMEALMRQYEELQAEVERKRQEEQEAMEEIGRQERKAQELERQKQEKRKNRVRLQLEQSSSSFVLSDNKTRAKQTLPSIAQQRTTRMQLSVYKYMFDTLATRKANAAASSAYTAMSTDARIPSCLWTAKEVLADMQLDGSRTFTGVMLTHLLASGFPAHTTLLSLINLYLHTFSSIHHPSSPFLSVHYEYQHDSSPLGSSSFPFSPLDFAVDLDWQLAYWLGLRSSEGVGEGMDEWKCRSCEFVVECDRTKWAGRAAKVKERKDEDDRRESERRRKKVEEESRAREEQRNKEQATEQERQARLDERRHLKVELEVGTDECAEAVGESKEDEGSATTVEVAQQGKSRRARKRRSLEEMTLTQEDELEKARKEKKLQDIILIDIDE